MIRFVALKMERFHRFQPLRVYIYIIYFFTIAPEPSFSFFSSSPFAPFFSWRKGLNTSGKGMKRWSTFQRFLHSARKDRNNGEGRGKEHRSSLSRGACNVKKIRSPAHESWRAERNKSGRIGVGVTGLFPELPCPSML